MIKAPEILFDKHYYLEINEARWATAEKILSSLPALKTCIDAGSGPGWFAQQLVNAGLNVFGFDGRPELAAEARLRVPEALFATLDITGNQAAQFLPRVDLVFCFGLLYHLENPFAAIRNLFECTEEFLLIETQIAPDEGPDCRLISEGRNMTQGLTYHALIPSRTSLVKMLYISGFSHVMRYTGRVAHDDFIDMPNKRHRREIFLASRNQLRDIPDFVRENEPITPKIDYSLQNNIKNN